MTAPPEPRFDHLLSMTDGRATFEHALLTAPRREHGYCSDDMARVLVVTAREPDASADVSRLRRKSFRFLADAQGHDGGFRNRMRPDGRWADQPAFGDWWGRSLWGLGTLIARVPDGAGAALAARQFAHSARRRSAWVRAMAFAALGAAEVLAVDPSDHEARRLLADAADRVSAARDGSAWQWPEPRLSYANAVLPEVLIAAGTLLDTPRLVRQGLDLLGWLLDHETVGGHLSVTPAGGGGPGAPRPAFDQQPIEVAALADACARAAAVDGDACWSRGVVAAVAWFLGDNDGGRVMWDPHTGGGYDGLHATGPNRNQGAESTLALLATLQHARRPAPVSVAT
ncbi:MAG TPA: hypothetical protein VHN98_10415 [Acidimicrobiales bacterium]|nr:hypothetical protein [Acidimicrobiales bacterium]